MDKEIIDMLKKIISGSTPGVWSIYKGEQGKFGIISDNGEKIVELHEEKGNQWVWPDSHGISNINDAILIVYARNLIINLINDFENTNTK